MESVGHEVDELLDAAKQGRLEVGIGSNGAEDALPRGGNVGLVGVWPPECLADAVLPLDTARNLRPRIQPDARRLDRLPDVDEWVADHQNELATWTRGDRLGDPALLGPRNPMVDEHADSSIACGLEISQNVFEIVDTLQILDHHALDSEVGAPHLLNQLGVVPTLDENPACPGDPGALVVGRDGAGCRALRPKLWSGIRCSGQSQGHRVAIDQETRTNRKKSNAAPTILESQKSTLVPNDRANEPGRDLLDNEVSNRLDHRRLNLWRPPPEIGEHIAAVRIVGFAHPARLQSAGKPPAEDRRDEGIRRIRRRRWVAQ